MGVLPLFYMKGRSYLLELYSMNGMMMVTDRNDYYDNDNTSKINGATLKTFYD
jgi:hypothetical protein